MTYTLTFAAATIAKAVEAMNHNKSVSKLGHCRSKTQLALWAV
jgi:hypothetical protein